MVDDMTLRRAISSVAIVGGSLLLSPAPAFAGTGGGEDTLPTTGSNGHAQNSLVVGGAIALVAGGSLVLVRRKGSARA
jgi:LPXTG-motif cell wall-anchored protein